MSATERGYSKGWSEAMVELLAFYDVEEDLILEYIDLEKEETTDEYLMEHFNYNELIYEL